MNDTEWKTFSAGVRASLPDYPSDYYYEISFALRENLVYDPDFAHPRDPYCSTTPFESPIAINEGEGSRPHPYTYRDPGELSDPYGD